MLLAAPATSDRCPTHPGSGSCGCQSDPEIKRGNRHETVFAFQWHITDAVAFCASCRELQARPDIRLCVCGREAMSYVRPGDKADLTADRSAIGRCFEAGPVPANSGIAGMWPSDTVSLRSYAEFASFSAELPNKNRKLPNKYGTAE